MDATSSDRNLGYAFLNLRSKDTHRDFSQAFQDVPASSCFPGCKSSKVCEVALSECQGREANMRNLCTSSNISKWLLHDEWSPIFLDDYGKKMQLEVWKDDDHAPRFRSASAQCSPVFKPQASPVLKPQGAPNGKSSPTLRAEAKVFSPPLRADAATFLPPPVVNAKVMSPQMSPSLRAEASEFVPSMALLPEPAFVG